MAKSRTILGKSGQNRVLWFESRENWNLFSTWEWHVPGTWGFPQERRRAPPLRRKSSREGGWKRKILDISLFKVTQAFYVYNTLICSSISCSLNECTSVMSPLNATNRHACDYGFTEGEGSGSSVAIPMPSLDVVFSLTHIPSPSKGNFSQLSGSGQVKPKRFINSSHPSLALLQSSRQGGTGVSKTVQIGA